MSISTKLVSLVEDLTTPLTIKSWLIPLFEHMTHDATVSMKVCFFFNTIIRSFFILMIIIGSSIIDIIDDK
jgi:hypothetical protein